MQCEYCGAELPKKAARCPECARTVKKKEKNIKPIAMAGLVISFVGSFFPMIQNSDAKKKYTPAFGFMNFEQMWLWYIFIAICAVGLILCAVKLEKISIACDVANVAIGFTVYQLVCMRHGAPGMETGASLYMIIIGAVIGVAGVFIDVLKFKGKENKDAIDFKYTGNKSVWKRIWIYKGFYLMFLPVLIFVIVFNYIPMAGLRYSFTDFKSGSEPTYAGIKQFVDMFFFWEPLSKQKSLLFLRAFKNTILLSTIKLFMNTAAAVIISLFLNELRNIKFKKSVQTIIYLPHFMSWVVVASIFKMILSSNDSGLLNQLLINLHLVDHKIEFLTGTTTWTIVYFLVNLWKDTGWGTILFLATLSGISPELYEAADIDGGGRWAKMRYITFPALANTIITVFILNLAKVMNLFESVFVMYNPSVYKAADVIQTYIYRESFPESGGTANYGYTTAVGLFKSIVACILVLICNKASKKVRGRGIV